jgi:hypothetical protein
MHNMTVSFYPLCISPKPFDCGVMDWMWKACMKMWVFYTWAFLQNAFFPPVPLLTGSFLHLFFTQCTSSPLLYMRFFTRRNLTQCVFFPLAPPPTGFFTLVFFTQCTFFPPSPTCVFLHESFFTECVFSSDPRQLVVFLHLGFFTQYMPSLPARSLESGLNKIAEK